MRAEEENKGKGKKKQKRKGKKGENGDFFLSPCAGFFICAVVIIKYIKKTVSRLK